MTIAYYEWKNALCRVMQGADGAMHAERFCYETHCYQPAPLRDILWHGVALNREETQNRLSSIRQ
jgi:hypothetical protein